MKRACIIIDDEKLAREKIQLYLQQTNDCLLKGSYSTASAFLEAWKAPENFLIFLDIDLPGINGLELASMISNGNQIIFTTAYSEFALQGFDLDAVDYLLKPFSLQRFLRAVAKAKNNFSSESPFLFIKEGKKTHRLLYQEIYYIEGLKEYVIWHTTRGRIVAYSSLKKLSEQLYDRGFFQIHKSFIVNFSKIDSFESNLIHINGSSLPIGRKYKQVTQEWGE